MHTKNVASGLVGAVALALLGASTTVRAAGLPALSLLPPSPAVVTPSSGPLALELFGDFTGFSMLGGGVDFAVNGPAAIIGFTPSPFLQGLDPAFTGWGSELADADFEVHLGSFSGFTGQNKLGDLAFAFTGIEYGPVQIDLSINTLFGGFFTTAGNPISVALVGTSFTLVPDPPTLVLPATVTAADAVAGTVVAGGVAPGLSVQVRLGDVSRSVVSDAAGAWTVSFPVEDLPGDGAQAVEAFAFDDRGNFSAAAAGEILFNIAATAGLAVDAVTPDDIINAVERSAGFVISGAAVPGTPVSVTAGGRQWSTTSVGGPIFADDFDGPVELGLVKWASNGGLVVYPAPGTGPQPPGPVDTATVTFNWATDGKAIGWTNSADNALAAMTNDTYFSSLTGNNSTAWYNADFATEAFFLALDPGPPGSTTSTRQCDTDRASWRQYACSRGSGTTQPFTVFPVADIGPGAKATGQLTVTPTSLTGTLTVINTNDEGQGLQQDEDGNLLPEATGYNVRNFNGSPFKNVWYGISNQMQLSVNLTGTFSGTSWEINGGTVGFFDPAFACGFADGSGTLCNPSTTAGGFRPNGQFLSWGLDQGAGADTSATMIPVFDAPGTSLLTTLSGVLASLSIDANGNITTNQGETRTGTGSTGGGCVTSLRYGNAGLVVGDPGISCGTLQVRKLDITGTLGGYGSGSFECVGGSAGCVALGVGGGAVGRIISQQGFAFVPGRQYVLEAQVAGALTGGGSGGVTLGLVNAATGEVVRAETFPGIVPGQAFAPYSISWFGSDLPAGSYQLVIEAQAGGGTGIVVDEVVLRDVTVPSGVGYWSVAVGPADVPADGSYQVIAAIGRAAAATRSFVVDTTPPPAPQVTVLDGAGTLAFGPIPADATRQISVNGTPVDVYQPPPQDGGYVVRVCDTDLAGNSSCTEVQFVVDLSPQPADDVAEVIAARTVLLPLLANDTIRRTPVTVTVAQAPLLGSVVVAGSPGQPAAIGVQYAAPAALPAGQLVVADDFVYRVSDGTTSRDATVALKVVRDTDGDGVPDYRDNCVNAANANQRDTRNTGIGNACNGDLKGKGTAPNFEDLALFRTRFGTSNADADFDGNGAVNFADLAIFRQLFARPLPPPLPLAQPATLAIEQGQAGSIDIAQIPGVRLANGAVTIGGVPYGSVSVSGTTVTYSPGSGAPTGPVEVQYTITDGIGRFSTAVLTAQVGSTAGGSYTSANVTFTWAPSGIVRAWTSTAGNSLSGMDNGTFFSDLPGNNSATYLNADFATEAFFLALDPGPPGSTTSTRQCDTDRASWRQYACSRGSGTTQPFTVFPVADVGPGAKATGTLTVTDTTMTGTLTVINTNDEGQGLQQDEDGNLLPEATGYNIRSADGSPFKNVWYGISNQMQLTVNLTGTFSDTAWEITGGTVSFFDPAFQCGFADGSGTLCNPSTTAGGFRPNGQMLSWGIDQGTGPGTGATQIPVFDAAGGTLLTTLSGVLASLSIDASGNITTTRGEVRSATGSSGGGCLTSIRYGTGGLVTGVGVTCGTLNVAPFVITGTAVR